MGRLSLHFRLDDLTAEPRELAGEIDVARLDEVVAGLVGGLGYRALAPVAVAGTVYLAERDVVVRGDASVEVGFDCARCLRARRLPVAWHFDHVLVPRGVGAHGGELVVDETLVDEPDETTYEGEEIDLVALLREDVVLELPMNPRCVDAGAEACRSALEGAVPDEPEVDPRWAPLVDLKKKLTRSRN